MEGKFMVKEKDDIYYVGKILKDINYLKISV